jgi:hypothetical protein
MEGKQMSEQTKRVYLVRWQDGSYTVQRKHPGLKADWRAATRYELSSPTDFNSLAELCVLKFGMQEFLNIVSWLTNSDEEHYTVQAVAKEQPK